jgi:hypothetical protein
MQRDRIQQCCGQGHDGTDLVVKLVIGRKEWGVTEFNLASFLPIRSFDGEHVGVGVGGKRRMTACAAPYKYPSVTRRDHLSHRVRNSSSIQN